MTAQKHDSAKFRCARLLGSPDTSKLVPARHILATAAILLGAAKLSVIIDLRRFAGSALLASFRIPESPSWSSPGTLGALLYRTNLSRPGCSHKADLGMLVSH